MSLYTIKGGMQGGMGRVYRRGRVYRSIQERKSTQVATTMLLLADRRHAYGALPMAPSQSLNTARSYLQAV